MREITDAEVARYHEDGVVHLPGLLDEGWLTRMEAAFTEAMFASAGRDRRAFALRYLGDDVRYLEREGVPPDSQRSPELRDGDRMDSAEFPLIWSADGESGTRAGGGLTSSRFGGPMLALQLYNPKHDGVGGLISVYDLERRTGGP